MSRALKTATLNAGLALLVGLAGCGKAQDGDDASGDACDPLAPVETALQLGDLFATGRHSDGTIYVVDTGDPPDPDYPMPERVFASIDDVLLLQPILGRGDFQFELLDAAGGLYYLMLEDVDGQMTIFFTRDDPEQVPDPAREALEHVAETEVLGMEALEIQNPDMFALGEVENGKVVAIACDVGNAFCPEEGVLFYGDPARLLQREVIEAMTDNSAWAVEFRIGSKSARMIFPWDGEPTLRMGEDVLAIDMLDPEATDLGGYAFYCVE